MKAITLLLATLSFASSAYAARPLTAMNYAEKSAYALQRLVNQKKVDESFLTDVNGEKIQVSSTGAEIQLQSPSADPQILNTINLSFDNQGKLLNFTTSFSSKNAQSPIFSPTNAATIIDLGAEAIVDHLTESPDLPVVAENAQSLNLAREGSAIHIRILLKDGRTYNILMDGQAKVISKGF